MNCIICGAKMVKHGTTWKCPGCGKYEFGVSQTIHDLFFKSANNGGERT